MTMNNSTYWDSFDCQIQCEEIYTEDPFINLENFETESEKTDEI